MFDIGWTELLVIGIVALIVIGPKDLPVMFKTLGRFTARARQMAREFQRAMEQAADDSGIKDVAKDLKDAASPAATGMDKLKEAATKFEQWNPAKPMQSAAKMAAGAAMAKTATASPASAADAPAPAAALATAPGLNVDAMAGTAAPKAAAPAAATAESGLGQTLMGAGGAAALAGAASLLPDPFAEDAADDEEHQA